MARDCAVFVRNNRTPSMAPLRDRLTRAGLADVASFGSSGNFVFSAADCGGPALERTIADALGAEVFVRTRAQLAELSAANPFAENPAAIVFLLTGEVDVEHRVFTDAAGAHGERPVAVPGAVWFVHPLHYPGRRTIVDLERELGVRGTMRTSRVVNRILDLMEPSDD